MSEPDPPVPPPLEPPPGETGASSSARDPAHLSWPPQGPGAAATGGAEAASPQPGASSPSPLNGAAGPVAPPPGGSPRPLTASEVVARLLADPRLHLRLATDLPSAAPQAGPALVREARSSLPLTVYAPDSISGTVPGITAASQALSAAGLAGIGGPDAGERALRSLEYVVVDVETTGGSVQGGHRITEVGVVRIAYDGTLLDEYTTLVNPERPIPPFISALTNISWEMVRDAPRFANIAGDVARILDGGVFVAHNAAFDWRFVSTELESATGAPPRTPRLCTVRLARKVVPEVASRSLDALTYYFGLANVARHRAWGDARVTAQLLTRLLARLDEREVFTWAALEELLGRRKPRKSRRRQAMPSGMDPSDIPAQ